MKKNLALDLLTSFQEIAKDNLDFIKIDKGGKKLFAFIDIDPASKFYFSVLEKNGDDTYRVGYAPESSKSVQSALSNLSVETASKQFKEWVAIVKTYAELETVFDDPALKKHEEYFQSTFEIVDEDASYAPFEIPKQLLLASYIESIENFIEINKDDFKDETEPALLIAECQELVEELPNLSKKSVISRVSTVCAKIAKNGMSLLKKFLSTSSPEFAKKIGQLTAENIITIVKNHAEDITSLLN